MENFRSQGREEFARGDFAAALDSFQKSLSVVPNDSAGAQKDRQLLLSNAVACRLQLGGVVQATAAVDDAKACIECDPSWSKAHVRLASAYVALNNLNNSESRGGAVHSNAACVALQTALRLDPSNQVARQMLVHELSSNSDRSCASLNSSAATAAATTARTSVANGSDASQDDVFIRDPPVAPSYVPPRHETVMDASGFMNANNSYTDRPRPSVSQNSNTGTASHRHTHVLRWNFRDMYNRLQILVEQLRHELVLKIQRAMGWYLSLSQDGRTAVHSVAFLLALYVAFGGRFGASYLCSSNGRPRMSTYKTYDSDRSHEPPYPHRTDYDNHHHNRDPYSTTSSRNTQYNERETTSSYPYQQQDRRRQEQHQQYNPPPDQYNKPRAPYSSYDSGRGGGSAYYGSSSSYNSFSEWNGLLYMGATALAVAIGHRFGISPWQVVMAMRMMNGRGGGFRPGGFGGGGGYRGGGWGGRRHW